MVETTFVAFIVVNVFTFEVGVEAFVERSWAFLGYHQV